MIETSIGEPTAELRASLSSQVHLWISDLDIWTREETEKLLTDDELARARTLRHPVSQQNYLAGRALVRAALSHYTGSRPLDWTFAATRLGRPEIAGPQPIPQLRFNLTHTRGLAACVVTATADCGVDVEQVDRPLRPLRIAEHSFARAEFEDLESRSPADLRERFFSYWTLKEAYYKARGSGIPFRLGGARFDLTQSDRIHFLPSADEDAEAAGWQFWLIRPTLEHVLAVAIESGREPRLGLRCFGNSASGTPTDFAPIDLVAERTVDGANGNADA